MNRIESMQIQRNARRAGLEIPEMLRGDKPRQIKRTGISLGDKYESRPEIEHFNNYSKNGILVNEVCNSKCNNGVQDYNIPVIDMRMGDTYETFQERFRNRYPKDENNDWEIYKVFYDDEGNPTTTHKLPPEEYRIVTIYEGPLAVRYDREIVSVSFNKDGVQGGCAYRYVDFEKVKDDRALLRSEMDRIESYVNQGVRDYADGKIGAGCVEKIIESIYKDLVSLSIKLGNTDGNDPKINADILSSAQGMFISRTLTETMRANDEEGAAYAYAKHGLPANSAGAYYNAKYFYANKDLQEIGMNVFPQVAKQEGLDSFNVHDYFKWQHAMNCFNKSWHQRHESVAVKMKDTGLEPPRDFVMYFTPRRFSMEEQHNYGITQKIIFSDASQHEGRNSFALYFKAPKGISSFRELPLWVTQGSYVNEDGVSITTWDITKHINLRDGEDLLSRVKEFFAKHVNVYDGNLSIWSNGIKSEHEIIYDFFTNDKRYIQGSSLTDAMKHNDFVNNFVLYLY